MGWLLSGLLLVAGVVVLAVVGQSLLVRLRRGRAAVAVLRFTFADGAGQLRAGKAALRERRKLSRGSHASDRDA